MKVLVALSLFSTLLSAMQVRTKCKSGSSLASGASIGGLKEMDDKTDKTFKELLKRAEDSVESLEEALDMPKGEFRDRRNAWIEAWRMVVQFRNSKCTPTWHWQWRLDRTELVQFPEELQGSAEGSTGWSECDALRRQANLICMRQRRKPQKALPAQAVATPPQHPEDKHDEPAQAVPTQSGRNRRRRENRQRKKQSEHEEEDTLDQLCDLTQQAHQADQAEQSDEAHQVGETDQTREGQQSAQADGHNPCAVL